MRLHPLLHLIAPVISHGVRGSVGAETGVATGTDEAVGVDF